MNYLTDEHYEIASKKGITKARAYQRFYVRGWSLERAISEKPQKQRRGLWKQWGELATVNGISKTTFYARVCTKKDNMTPEQAATTKLRKKVKS